MPKDVVLYVAVEAPRLLAVASRTRDAARRPRGRLARAVRSRRRTDFGGAIGLPREACRVLESGGRLGTKVRKRPNQLGLIKRRARKTHRTSNLADASDKPGSGITVIADDQGFVPRILEVRAFISVFRGVAKIVDLLETTSCSHRVPPRRITLRSAAHRKARFAGEYADRVSSDGIRLERWVMLAVADKPA
jgi:hypothetical protein